MLSTVQQESLDSELQAPQTPSPIISPLSPTLPPAPQIPSPTASALSPVSPDALIPVTWTEDPTAYTLRGTYPQLLNPPIHNIVGNSATIVTRRVDTITTTTEGESRALRCNETLTLTLTQNFDFGEEIEETGSEILCADGSISGLILKKRPLE